MITTHIQKNIAILGINVANQPMNVLNSESIAALAQALGDVYGNTDIKGIIITSERPEFIAGADLKMILENNGKAPEELLKLSLELNHIFRKMETNGKPIVAAINGTALGGGFEVCLACHYRVALDTPKSVIGLPEVTLGLLPGGGGTQRLPRMIGIEKAAPLLLEGKKVSPKEALQLGLVNDLATSYDEMIQKAIAWIEANPHGIQPWDEVDRKTGKIKAQENYKVPGGNILSPKGVQLMMGGTAMTLNKTHGNYPAPIAIMSCVYEGLLVNIDRAIVIEARHFVKVANSSVAKNLIKTMFFGLNEVNKGAGRPKNTPSTEVKKLGILGAGMMGAGIAYVSAMAGIKVILKDTSLANAEKGKSYSEKLLDKAIERGKMTLQKAEQILSCIKPTDHYDDLADTDLIIEAVFENTELKASVTQEAEKYLHATGVFASNTSTLPITKLAQASQNPQRFIGIHFFSPVDKMQLVEIIVGKETNESTIALAMDYVKKIRKTPIVVNDSRGFYTSRVFTSYTSEGIELLKDGVNPTVIENVAKLMGMPVGPLAVSDEVALDLIYRISGEAVKAGALPETDSSYQISKQFTEMGRLGKKAKAGFYEYPDPSTGQKKYIWEGLKTLFPLQAQQPSASDIRKRLLYRQVLETIKCFEEGVVKTPLDADLGSILAWGFPAYLGGTFSFVETEGIQTFVLECDRLADTYGERFRPTNQLREKAQKG